MRRIAVELVVAVVGCVLIHPSVHAQSGPEEKVLQEVFFADKPSTVLAHLPESFRTAMRDLTPAVRSQLESALLVGKRVCERAKCSVPNDGSSMLLAEPGGDEARRIEIRLRRKLSDGRETVLQLEGVRPDGIERTTVKVWMRVEEGVWRIAEVEFDNDEHVFDDAFVKRFACSRLDGNEAAAVGCLRTLNTSQVTYASTYPEIGFARSLQALGGKGGSSSAAGLIDSVLASGVKSGYTFEMRTADDQYEISARPTSYGGTGKRSFFTDQSGVIRFTDEDRQATAKNAPLQ